MAKFILGDVLKKKSWSKRRFAMELDERYSDVFRYFRKGYDPKLSKLSKFAKALKCKISDLYSE